MKDIINQICKKDTIRGIKSRAALALSLLLLTACVSVDNSSTNSPLKNTAITVACAIDTSSAFLRRPLTEPNQNDSNERKEKWEKGTNLSKTNQDCKETKR